MTKSNLKRVMVYLTSELYEHAETRLRSCMLRKNHIKTFTHTTRPKIGEALVTAGEYLLQGRFIDEKFLHILICFHSVALIHINIGNLLQIAQRVVLSIDSESVMLYDDIKRLFVFLLFGFIANLDDVTAHMRFRDNPNNRIKTTLVIPFPKQFHRQTLKGIYSNENKRKKCVQRCTTIGINLRVHRVLYGFCSICSNFKKILQQGSSENMFEVTAAVHASSCFVVFLATKR